MTGSQLLLATRQLTPTHVTLHQDVTTAPCVHTILALVDHTCTC